MKKITTLSLFLIIIYSGYSQTTLGLYTERTVTSSQTLNTTFGSNIAAQAFLDTATDSGTDGGTNAIEIQAQVDDTNTQAILNYNPRLDATSYDALHISLKSNSPDPTILRIEDANNVQANLTDLVADYGFAYDGNWHSLVIPLADFTTANNAIDLTVIKNVFVIKTEPGATFSSSTYLFYIDDVYLSSGSFWIGTTSDWNTPSNWSTGVVPSSMDDVSIPSGTPNDPIISATTGASSNNLIVETGATLNITSGGSLIVNGTSTGEVTYNRSLATTNWYLVSSPVDGETMTDMIANNNFDTNASNEISFAPYDNTQAVSSDKWVYYANTATDALDKGKGYSTKLSPSGDISFTGTINVDDVAIPLSQGGVNGDDYNLLGNPYTAYVNSATFLINNTAELTQQEIYVWNQATDTYETKISGDTFIVAPGQGFFVEASSTNTVTFTEAMQSHETTDTFQKSSRPEISLSIADDTSSRTASIYYIDGKTTGFDNGYDGKLFSGIAQPFALYTHLVANSEGKNYQIQSLPNSNLESMVIPIGINANAGKEITFSATRLNLSSEINIYLEDRLTNTFTVLDEQTTSKVTLEAALNGIGRFYLHTTAQKSLSINDDIALENISAYKTNDTTLRIAGLQQGNTSFKLFNILGKKVLDTSFESNGVKDISLPKMASGLYVIQLETELGNLTKKIVLK